MHRDMSQIIQIMNQNYDRNISMYDQSFLIKTVDKRLSTLGIEAYSDFLHYLTGSDSEARLFHEALNITYSDFFRNPLTFGILEQWILPKIIEKKAGAGEIRVWSAGCSSGQEAYSLAMLLDKLITAKADSTRFRILGSDTSEGALAAARKGVYDVSAMGNVNLRYLEDYFIKSGDSYSVSPKLKKNVDFTSYDLLDRNSDCPQESIFGDFDLVFCCNLIFYYQPEQQKFIIDKVLGAITPGGYLATGEAEKYFLSKIKELKEVAPPTSLFQKK